MYRYQPRPHRLRLLNLSLIIALLISVSPLWPTTAQAAPARTTAADLCYVAGVGARLFLPMVAMGQSQPATAQVAAVTGTTPRELRYQLGKTYTYHYDLAVESQAVSREADGTAAVDGQALGVIADVDLSITEQTAAEGFAGMVVMRNVTICSAELSGVGTVVEDADLIAALQAPLLFQQQPNGVISQVAFPVGAPDTAVNLQKGILNALQLTLQAGSNLYTVEESGGQGQYQVAYTLTDSPAGLQIQKTFNQDSFIAMLYAGDENAELLLQNQSELLLDAEQGVVKTVTVNETIVSADESADAPSTDGGAVDGVVANSGAKTHGTLRLTGVTDMPSQAAALTAPYVDGTLGAVIEDSGPFRPGIDLTTVDVAAELTALEAAPDDPALVKRLSDLLAADDDGTVLAALRGRLQAVSANDAQAMGYIDALGVNSSPAAQTAMADTLAAPFSAAVQEHALIAFVGLPEPTTPTLQLVARIANDPNATLRDTALLVLGALLYVIEDPTGGVTGSLLQQLRDGLQNAADDATRIRYLDAIGNAGDATAYDLLVGFVANTQPFDVREAALAALRKLTVDGAEAQLVQIMTDSAEDEVLREVAANLLRGRVLSTTAAAALATYEGTTTGEIAAAALNQANDLSYKKTWNKHLGGSKFGVDLPGSVAVAEKTQPVRNVSLVGRQEAVAHAWSFKYNIALAEVTSKRVADKQQFRVYFGLLNNKVKKEYVKEAQCAYEKTGNLYKATRTLIDVSQSIPVYAIISVDLGIRAVGNVSLDYTYNHDICNPLHPLVAGSITPAVSATLEGYAALSIKILRGGASVEGKLLDTSIPAKLTAKRDDSFQLCIDITVKTKPLTIKVKIFAERIKLNGKWKRFAEKTLFQYETPQKNYPLLVQCL